MKSSSETWGALVTGGCGFVGRHLVLDLVDSGAAVWIIDDLSTGMHPLNWLGFHEPVATSIPNTTKYERDGQVVLFSESDIIPFLYAVPDLDRVLQVLGVSNLRDVFHLASVVGGRAKIEGDPLAVGVDLAIDSLFFRWAVQNRQQLERILYASSSAAYPIHLQNEGGAIALKEEFISFDEDLGQPDMTYGWSKLTGEYLAELAAAQYGLSVACVRPFSGYGGDQDLSYPVPAIARRAAAKEDPLVVWGSGLQGRDFVHIDDCIEAMRLTLDCVQDGSGVNIGSGQLTTFLELAQLFADLAGYRPEIKGLEGKPVGVHSRYADTTHMEQVLNWKPRISLRDGMTLVLREQMSQL